MQSDSLWEFFLLLLFSVFCRFFSDVGSWCKYLINSTSRSISLNNSISYVHHGCWCTWPLFNQRIWAMNLMVCVFIIVWCFYWYLSFDGFPIERRSVNQNVFKPFDKRLGGAWGWLGAPIWNWSCRWFDVSPNEQKFVMSNWLTRKGK